MEDQTVISAVWVILFAATLPNSFNSALIGTDAYATKDLCIAEVVRLRGIERGLHIEPGDYYCRGIAVVKR